MSSSVPRVSGKHDNSIFATPSLTDDLLVKVVAHLTNAEIIYKHLATATLAEKDSMASELCSAWNCLWKIKSTPQHFVLTPSDEAKLARITLLWGKCHWAAVDMEISRQAFSLSLVFAIGDFEFHSNGLGLKETLERLKNDKSNFYRLETGLTDSAKCNAIVEQALAEYDRSKPDSAAIPLAVAAAARELGGTYQNNVLYKPAEGDRASVVETKIARCHNVLKMAEDIWTAIGTPETKWLLLTTKYNTKPFLHRLRHPNDTTAPVQILHEVLKDLDTLEAEGNKTIELYQQRAQCYNKLAVEQKTTLSAAERYKLISQAAEIALDNKNKGFDVSLLKMFPHNRASVAFKAIEEGNPIEGTSIEQIDECLTSVQKICFQNGYNHFYDAIFCLTAAKVANHLGDKERAKNLVKTARDVCDKFPSSTGDIRKDIDAFETEKLQ